MMKVDPQFTSISTMFLPEAHGGHQQQVEGLPPPIHSAFGTDDGHIWFLERNCEFFNLNKYLNEILSKFI
jgi:hypothetical protein